ncbi:hypothetical protein ACOMHN_012353 [Nucella lapillus]
MKQKPAETVAQFVTRLRKSTQGCELENVNTQIKDQVVEKCTSDKLCRRFLARGDTFTLDILLKLASTFEVVERSKPKPWVTH